MELYEVSQLGMQNLVGAQKLVAFLRGVDEEVLTSFLVLERDGVAPHPLTDPHQERPHRLVSNQTLRLISTNDACNDKQCLGSALFILVFLPVPNR